jgi:hypothetical protein
MMTGPVAVRVVRSAKSSSFVMIVEFVDKSVIPNINVIRFAEANIFNMLGVMALLNQPTNQGGRQLSVNYKDHGPTIAPA